MKNYKMQWQSSSNPFLTLMMMFNIETKFVCTPSGNQFCLSFWVQKSNCLRYLRSFSSPANEMNFLIQRYFFKSSWGTYWLSELEISKAKHFSILASLFLKRIMQAFNCGFECWYLFKQIQKCIWNDSFRQIFPNFTMMKFCIIVHSISVISCDLRIEIEIESTFEVARNICNRTLYEREEL